MVQNLEQGLRFYTEGLGLRMKTQGKSFVSLSAGNGGNGMSINLMAAERYVAYFQPKFLNS